MEAASNSKVALSFQDSSKREPMAKLQEAVLPEGGRNYKKRSGKVIISDNRSTKEGSPLQVAGTMYLWNVTEQNLEAAGKLGLTLTAER